eukprot:scaffold87983_cov75-Phaeocystis_antarctica.AAC.1
MDPRGGNPRSAHEGHDFLQTHAPTATAAQCASYIYSLESFTISDCEAPRACPQAKWLVVREDCATTHACLSSSAANGCGTGFGHLSFSIAVRASVYTNALALSMLLRLENGRADAGHSWNSQGAGSVKRDCGTRFEAGSACGSRSGF